MEIDQQARALLVKSGTAAKLLSVSERTLFTMTRRGDLPAVRIGRAVRYSVRALEGWIKRKEAGDGKRV